MNDILKGVLIGVIPTAIIAFLGYIWVIKENQLSIDLLKEEVRSISANQDERSKSVNSIKLFIASAHPNKDLSPLLTSTRISELSSKEVADISEILKNLPKQEALNKLKSKYKFNKAELQAFQSVLVINENE